MKSVSSLFLAIFCILLQSTAQINTILPADNDELFIENKGQLADQFEKPRPDVLYYGSTSDVNFYLKKKGISYQFYRVNEWREVEILGSAESSDSVPESMKIYRIDVNWLGINSTVTTEKEGESSSHKTFYRPVCLDGVSSIRSYERITYDNIYNGIDLSWYENNGELEYDYLIEPYVNYKQIRFEVLGATEIKVNDLGELVVATPLGSLVEKAPVAYQGNKQIEADWVVNGNEVSFQVSNYDRSLPLVIDPIVRSWGTYFGGNSFDYGFDIALDDSSNIFIVGRTFSPNLIATTGVHQTTYGGGCCGDAYMAKFDSSGTHIWGTYLGGRQLDMAFKCAVDPDGNIYMVGWAESDSVMASPGSYLPSIAGGRENGFLVKFNSAGTRIWGTYYGGIRRDVAYNCAVDAESNVYLVGETWSSTGIATSNGHLPVGGGIANRDAFLAKFNEHGVRQWGTYYGTPTGNFDVGNGVAIDRSGNVYLSGNTNSASGIATTGAHLSTFSGGGDAFLVKFDSNGVRQWGTYYGDASGGTTSWRCAVDTSLNVYLAGSTNAKSGIATVEGYQTAFGGGVGFVEDAFLVKFDSNGLRQWATYFGGDEEEALLGCVTDDSLNVLIVGFTESDSLFKNENSYQQSYGGGDTDGFFVKIG